MPSKTVGANDLEKVKQAVLNIGRMRLRATSNACTVTMSGANDETKPFSIINVSSTRALQGQRQGQQQRRRGPAPKRSSSAFVSTAEIIRLASKPPTPHQAGKRATSGGAGERSSETSKVEVRDDEGPLSPAGSYDSSSPSVERRNARERNRVKMVNDGYDALRRSIPSARSVEKQKSSITGYKLNKTITTPVT
jgi:hypothetical protein